MRAPLLWLADYVDLEVGAEAVAERLTMAGIEVGRVESVGAHWGAAVRVGEVLSIDPHPNADRLLLVTVDFRDGQIQVVTGAANFSVGDRVPLAQVGAMLYNAYKEDRPLEELRPAKLRGVESRGMICSGAELGISDDHSGILVLPPDAPVGAELGTYLGGEAIELDLKPDRADCLSMLGVARYVAGLFERPFKSPQLGDHRMPEPPPALEVSIEDSTDCPRYSVAYLTDIQIGPSPDWLARRLEAAGQRPINNIVDITNFVMLEYGQPLHAFDRDKLAGEFIGVRRARSGEELLTLDQNLRQLSEEDLVIVDADGPVGLAGVMGGFSSEVTAETRTILLESANFSSRRIRNTARRLGLPSEAARRFEQRLSPETTVPALRRAIGLAEEMGAGRGQDVWADAYPDPEPERKIRFDPGQIKRLLGVDYPRDVVVGALRRAGFDVAEMEAELAVAVPHYRGDVSGSADLVEEVAAMIGFDSIPASLPSGGLPDTIPQEYDDRIELARIAMVAAGYQEAITYTLTSPERLAAIYCDQDAETDDLGARLDDLLMPRDAVPLAVHNPLRSEESVLKTSALPHLLEALSSNARYFDADVALFEIGKIYIPRNGELPDERTVLTALLGPQLSLPARQGQRASTFFDARGAAEQVLRRFNLVAGFAPCAHPVFSPGRAAAISIGETLIGAVGQLNPAVLERFSVDGAAHAVLLSLDRLLGSFPGPAQFANLPRYPAVLRDLSIVIDPAHPSSAVEDLIRSSGRPLIESARLVDEYRGDQVPQGMRGLTYAITYRDAGTTLTEKAVDRRHRGVVKALGAKFGAKLRA
ncbi:MAG: phenylalanine--tRNA ligase subunit beta [Chloroflexi bacterium]|nr:phenylalanine--tRNA ligase subunit beta [Chloroflexota bacterium]MYC47588.1 phenylalanine--tRNA ligase subunit beta [Chloroflexota bacterium]